MSVVARWKSLLLAETVALTTVAFVVVGVLVAGAGVPGPGAVGDFFGGLTSGWAELLAGTPPTDLTPELRVVPFTLTWVGTAIGLEVLRRIPQPALPILGPLATFVVDDAAHRVRPHHRPRRRGDADRRCARRSASCSSVRCGRSSPTSSTRRRPAAAGSAVTAALVLLVALVAPWLGPRLPLAEANERYDLRNEVVPPWNPLELPEPADPAQAGTRHAGGRGRRRAAGDVHRASPTTSRHSSPRP